MFIPEKLDLENEGTAFFANASNYLPAFSA
jgi:hypothetical protein